MRYADIGSISHGTMRAADLLETFASELDSLLAIQPRSFKRAPYRALIREAHKCLRHMEDGTVEQAQAAKDAADDIVNELFETLGEFAPPYFYFGSHPGDGAEYGFWISEEIEYSFDGLKVEDTSDIPRGYRGEVLHVNDHGNMTLYVAMSRGKLREIWAVV